MELFEILAIHNSSPLLSSYFLHSNNTMEERIISNDALQIFEQFKLLPSELRTEIWKPSLKSKPQIIPFDVQLFGRFESNESSPAMHIIPPPHLPVPTIFHVCKESRGVALEYYEFNGEFQMSHQFSRTNGSNLRVRNIHCAATKLLTDQRLQWDPKRDVVLLR
jgi:hypothetical protein